MASELITQVEEPGGEAREAGKWNWWNIFCGSCRRSRGESNVGGREMVVNRSPVPQSINIDFAQEESEYLLPPPKEGYENRKLLVLDLDETLVHSSFKPVQDADFFVDIELDNTIHRVYVRKRPGVDLFLKEVAKEYELVVFTASLSKYADPVMDVLDPERYVCARLFREHCVYHSGNYVKDLTKLGRPMDQIIIVDNSPFSFMFQPENAIPITSWFQDKSDWELYLLIDFLNDMADCADVCTVLARRTIEQMLLPFKDRLPNYLTNQQK